MYDSKYSQYFFDTSVTPPNNAPASTYWRYQLKLSDPGKYVGQFAYDSKGRATDVWKLQDASQSAWRYVQTHTECGAGALYRKRMHQDYKASVS